MPLKGRKSCYAGTKSRNWPKLPNTSSHLSTVLSRVFHSKYNEFMNQPARNATAFWLLLFIDPTEQTVRGTVCMESKLMRDIFSSFAKKSIIIGY